MVEAMAKVHEDEKASQNINENSQTMDSPSKAEKLQRMMEELKSQLRLAQDRSSEQELQMKLHDTEFERVKKELAVTADERE